MSTCCPDILGSNPANIKWNIIRGDTAVLTVEFLNNDEVTYFDASGWDFVATAYDSKNDSFDELEIDFSDNKLTITALPDVTENWGSGVKGKISELSFDVQVTMPDDTVWTPVIGIISVIADVTGGYL
jgi:hypothetical protein